MVTLAQQQRSEGVTRREAGLAALAALAALSAAPQPAHALFGFGNEKAQQRYEKETVSRGGLGSVAARVWAEPQRPPLPRLVTDRVLAPR